MNQANENLQGLYRESFEHDNCGIGAIVNIKGKKSHSTVRWREPAHRVSHHFFPFQTPVVFICWTVFASFYRIFQKTQEFERKIWSKLLNCTYKESNKLTQHERKESQC